MWVFHGRCRAGEFDGNLVSMRTEGATLDAPDAAKKVLSHLLADMDPGLIVNYRAQGNTGPGEGFLGSSLQVTISVPVDLNRPPVGEQIQAMQPTALELPGDLFGSAQGPGAVQPAQPSTES